ncbi:MAG: hypothetical protein ACLPT4_15375 [Verrucomicrobiia bacterium]
MLLPNKLDLILLKIANGNVRLFEESTKEFLKQVSRPQPLIPATASANKNGDTPPKAAEGE